MPECLNNLPYSAYLTNPLVTGEETSRPFSYPVYESQNDATSVIASRLQKNCSFNYQNSNNQLTTVVTTEKLSGYRQKYADLQAFLRPFNETLKTSTIEPQVADVHHLSNLYMVYISDVIAFSKKYEGQGVKDNKAAFQVADWLLDNYLSFNEILERLKSTENTESVLKEAIDIFNSINVTHHHDVAQFLNEVGRINANEAIAGDFKWMNTMTQVPLHQRVTKVYQCALNEVNKAIIQSDVSRENKAFKEWSLKTKEHIQTLESFDNLCSGKTELEISLIKDIYSNASQLIYLNNQLILLQLADKTPEISEAILKYEQERLMDDYNQNEFKPLLKKSYSAEF